MEIFLATVTAISVLVMAIDHLFLDLRNRK